MGSSNIVRMSGFYNRGGNKRETTHSIQDASGNAPYNYIKRHILSNNDIPQSLNIGTINAQNVLFNSTMNTPNMEMQGFPRVLSSKIMSQAAGKVYNGKRDFLRESRDLALEQKIFLSNNSVEVFNDARDLVLNLHSKGIKIVKQGIPFAMLEFRDKIRRDERLNIEIQKHVSIDEFICGCELLWKIRDSRISLDEMFPTEYLDPENL